MSYGTRVALGLAGGYVLGRYRKTRWLVALTALAATGRAVQRGTAAFDSSPELKQLAEQTRETAAALAGNQMQGLTKLIHSKTESLRLSMQPPDQDQPAPDGEQPEKPDEQAAAESPEQPQTTDQSGDTAQAEESADTEASERQEPESQAEPEPQADSAAQQEGQQEEQPENQDQQEEPQKGQQEEQQGDQQEDGGRPNGQQSKKNGGQQQRESTGDRSSKVSGRPAAAGRGRR